MMHILIEDSDGTSHDINAELQSELDERVDTVPADPEGKVAPIEGISVAANEEGDQVVTLSFAFGGDYAFDLHRSAKRLIVEYR
jgi:hypothetical protein